MQDAHHAEDTAKTDSYRDEVLMRLTALEDLMREERARQSAGSGSRD
jgi:voltage-gated sodium channel